MRIPRPQAPTTNDARSDFHGRPVTKNTHPVPPSADWHADAVAERMQACLSSIARCRKSSSEEAVHDARVALRRLSAALDFIGPALPDVRVRKLRRQAKRNRARLAKLRDRQVAVLLVADLCASVPELESYRAHLRAKGEKVEAESRRVLTRLSLPGLARTVSSVSRQYGALSPSQIVMQKRRLLKETGALCGDVLERRDLALAGDMDAWHRFRIGVKRLRYRLEITRPLYPRLRDAHMKALRRVQTELGDLHDLVVVARGFEKFAFRKKKMHPRSAQDVQSELDRIMKRYRAKAARASGFLPRLAAVLRGRKP